MDLLRDIRFAGRLLVKNRWFTVMAVVVLALGIGANNAVFTIVNGILLRNLPVAEPEDAAYVLERSALCHGFYGASSMERLPTERALTEQTRAFTKLRTTHSKV